MAALMYHRNDDKGQNEGSDPTENEKHHLIHRSSYSFGSHYRWLEAIFVALAQRAPRRSAGNKVFYEVPLPLPFWSSVTSTAISRV
jgi:hypothetical protein